jgi:hypothetical protein
MPKLIPRLRRAITEATGPLDRYQPPSQPSVKPTATKTRMYTYFTTAGETKLLYSAENWMKARLILEDAGPVSIGMDQNITPVLSGKGILLTTNVEIEFVISKGDRIFVAAEAINRVKFIIEPLPYVGLLSSIQSALDMLGRK